MESEKILTVLLVEDDNDVCQKYTEAFEQSPNLSLIGVTNNADRALETIEEMLPVALILDLELHQGKGNGLDVLKGIRERFLTRYPYIVVTTNNSSNVTYDCARELGADFIFFKHTDGFSEETVMQFLTTMCPVIIKNQNHKPLQVNSAEAPVLLEKRQLNKVTTELNNVGISPKAVGYQYLVDAILIAAEGKQTSNLSLRVAQKHHKSEPSVERAMQNAISRAWNTYDTEDLSRFYTARILPERGMPTVTEFICFYAKKLRTEFPQ